VHLIVTAQDEGKRRWFFFERLKMNTRTAKNLVENSSNSIGEESAKNKMDVRQEITDKIINFIEKYGWKGIQTLRTNALNGMPTNGISLKKYRGANSFYLHIERVLNDYSSGVFLTFAQVKSLGGHVNKGEKGYPAFFYKLLTTEDDSSGLNEINSFPVINRFVVFNLAQVTLPEKALERFSLSEASHINNTHSYSIDYINKIINHHRVTIETKALSTPSFSPNKDLITMPEIKEFFNSNQYYSTLSHELVHWVGGKNRLGLINYSDDYKKDYAFEELIAELGAAFLGCETGFVCDDIIREHSDYLAFWVEILKKDKNAFFKACSTANARADFLCGFNLTIN
jgi:antirestriction protein ArdC